MKKNKTWLIYLFCSAIISYLALWFLVFIINPKFKYNNNFFPQNKIGYYQEFSKKSYEKLNFNSYTLVFGTSRSHYIDSDILNEPTLNLHAVYGNPYAVFNFLSQLKGNQVQNIKSIIYMLDVHVNLKSSFTNKIDYKNKKFNFRSFVMTDINEVKDTFKSFWTKHYMTEFGYPSNFLKDTTIHPNEVPEAKLKHGYLPDSLDEVIKIQKFCKDNDLDLIILTPTFPMETLRNFDLEVIFNKWKFLLDSGLEKFYGIWWIDNISNLKSKEGRYLGFRDMSHLNYEYQSYIMKKYVLNENDKYLISDVIKLDEVIKHIEIKIRKRSLIEKK